MDCSLTFDDLLKLDETDENVNFLQNIQESAVQPQQQNNSSELRRDYLSGKGKQDFNPETSSKTPTKVISNKGNSSPWILEAQNPGDQSQLDTKYGNSGVNKRILDFEDSLAPEEKYGSEKFPENLLESAVQSQLTNNSNQLRRKNNLGEKTTDFDPETTMKTYTKIIASNRSSTGPLTLEAPNPGDQRSEDPKYGNIEDNRQTDGTLALYGLLALKGNFQQNLTEAAAQLQQANNSCELQKDNDSVNKKLDFGIEAILKTPTKIITIKRKSTSPRILVAQNPGDQRTQDKKYGNSGSKRHMECSLAFGDLLALEGKDGTENFKQNLVESAVQPQQASSLFVLRRDNNSEKMKSVLDPEISMRAPTKIIISKASSTDYGMLAQNTVKLPQDTKCGNMDDYRLYYDTSAASYVENCERKIMEENSTFSCPSSSNIKSGQKGSGNARQQQQEFQRVNRQNKERNELEQKNFQFIYGQSHRTNIVQPGNILYLRNDLPKPLPPGEKVHTFGYFENHPRVYYPKTKNRYGFWGSIPRNTKPGSNTSGANYPQNQKIPTRSQHTVPLHSPRPGQNKHPSTNLFSKTQTYDDSRGNTRKFLDTSVHQVEVKNTSHKRTRQKNADKNTKEKNANKKAQHKNSDKNAQKKHEEKDKQLEKAENVE